MSWGNLRRTLQTREVGPLWHPCPSTRSSVAEPIRNTGSAEAPSTVPVVEPVSPGCRWAELGSAETANPADGLFFNLKESITPLALSTNSYRMSVGETWNQPKPLAGGATRQAATHRVVRHVPPPDRPPVPRIK